MINIDSRALEALNPNEMWLMLHIVKRINTDRTAFPSKKTLLKDTGWKSEKTINAAMAGLIEKGMLQSIPRQREDGSQTSNLYRITTNLFGVYKPANELQDTVKNAPGGMQKMQGGEVYKMQGGGGKKDTPGGMQKMTPHEVLDRRKVLSNEVLNNEHSSFSNEKEPVGKVAEQFEKTGEPEPVKVPLAETPPKLRATPPANEVYQMYEVWAQFVEAKGIPVAKKPSGHYDMDGISANHLKLWAKWAMGMPGEGTPLERWQAFVQAAWSKADKFLKTKFTPSMLYNQRMTVVMAVNAQAVKDREYVEMAAKGFDFDAYLRGEIEIEN